MRSLRKADEGSLVELEGLERLWNGNALKGSAVRRLLIITQEPGALAGLLSGLDKNEYSCSIVPPDSGLAGKIAEFRPDLIVVHMNGLSDNTGRGDLIAGVSKASSVPVIALVEWDELSRFNGHLDFDDFMVSPYYGRELTLRVRRLVNVKSGVDSGLIKHNGLVIDLARCEVTVDGEPVELTFREYELLKFLAGSQGRVHTREALLNNVWGYDYYGGDRTVDVHIRRLRSKIEQCNKYIETVRNIGYRFKDGVPGAPRM